MDTRIVSIATVLPPCRLSTQQLLQELRPKLTASMARSIRRLGVRWRHTVLGNYHRFLSCREDTQHPQTTVTTLAAAAVTACLQRAAVDSSEVGLLIAGTNTPARLLPGLGPDLLAQCPTLPRTTAVLSLHGQGCATFLKALEVARWYLQAHPRGRAVVVMAEAQTPYFPPLLAHRYFSFQELQRRGGATELRRTRERRAEALLQAMLFGDGAAACLLATDGEGWAVGPICHLTNQQAEDADLLVMAEGGSRQPYVANRYPRFRMHPGAVSRCADYARRTVTAVLGHPDARVSSLRQATACLIHTGSRKILEAVSTALALPVKSPKVAVSYDVLRRYGNLSSAAIPFLLAQQWGTVGTAAVASFGVGFSASAGLLTFG